jgi:hypothetical protein
MCLPALISSRYLHPVGVIQAAAWGILGGTIAGLVSLSAAIIAVGFAWPWRDSQDGIWPRAVVFLIGIAVGGGVAAAAHGEMTGAWPAFIMGVGAPAVIRGALSHLEVEERKTPDPPAGGEGHGPG